MCGISGALLPDDVDAVARARAQVEDLVCRQTARGPDDRGLELLAAEKTAAVLGHNRLSIIDLSSAGHQPMWDEERRLCLSYNGEVYNYLELREELQALGCRFRSRSDSEVILAAMRHWGPARALSRFNGMFALAVFDTRSGRLLLARDRFGVKPLHYANGANRLLFASAPGPLAAVLRADPDPEYAARGLRYWVFDDDSEKSPYRGVRALPPGHLLEARLEHGKLETRLERWYDLRRSVEERTRALAGAGDAELLEEVARRLDRAVELRLRSDVPVGVSLSGGLDSSTVAALASRRGSRTTGISFGRPDAEAGEGPLVARFAKQVQIPVEFVEPRSEEEMKRALWSTLAAQQAPFSTGSVVAQYVVFARARELGYKVMLGGQGGDESFMGYRKFQLFRLRQLWSETGPLAALGFAVSLGRSLLAEASRWKAYLRAGRRYWKAEAGGVLRLPEPERLELVHDPREPLSMRQVADVMQFSLPTLLRYEDRNSMGNSIESRLPFVDYELVELALALPDGLKLRGGHTKWALRSVAKGLLPAEIHDARFKRGFDVDARWTERAFAPALREGLRSSGSRVAEWLAPGTDVDTAFSDDALRRRPQAFAEGVTLAWLAGADGPEAQPAEHSLEPLGAARAR